MKQFSLPSYLLPRMRDILFLILFSVSMAAGWRILNKDGDMPRHLLMGEVIVETLSIPSTELFSYANEGSPYVAHEWLADLIFYLFYRALGLKGVVFLTAILISCAFFALYWALSQDYKERFLMGFFILWGVANTYQHWIARPHMFTIFFLAIWLVITDRMARGKKVNLWLAPLLMILWGNSHAEFVAGFLVLIAYMAGWFWEFLFDRQHARPEVIRNLTITFGLSFLGTLINPFGLRTWTTILSYIGNNYLMSAIFETRPPVYTNPDFFVEFSLIIASILILSIKRGRYPGGHGFLLAGFTALAMTSGRNIHLYGVVAPFVIIGPVIEITDSTIQRKFNAAIAQLESQLKGFVWPLATVILFGVALATGMIGKNYVLSSKLFPVEAINWLEENPQSGQMFNQFRWGGYIVWHLWPEQKDFVDSQTVSEEAVRLYTKVIELHPGWQEVFEQYDIQWTLLYDDAPLAQELARDGWKVIYQDTTAIILQKE